MPIYPGRRPGTLRVVVWAKGEPHEEIVEGSKTEAKDVEARMRIELRARGASKASSDLRFSDLCETLYIPHSRARVAGSTWSRREFQLATLLEAFGDLLLSEFSTEAIDDFTSKRISQGHEPSYINGDLAVLRGILNFARVDRKLSVGDYRIRMLRTDKRRVKCWTSEEVARLLRAARKLDPEMGALLVFLLNTGCRKSEGVAAEWAWIEWRRRLLMIPVNERYRTKSRKPREIPLSDVLWSLLRRRERRTAWIFPTPLGERYGGFPDLRFRRVRDAAGLTGGPHTARHTYASHFLQSVPDLFELSAMLGHSHTRTTELYAHLLPGHHEKARNAVNLGGSRDERSSRLGAGAQRATTGALLQRESEPRSVLSGRRGQRLG